MKPWWTSRTLILNVLSGVGIALEAFTGQIRESFGPTAYLYFGIALAVANAILRVLTTQPIGTTDPKKESTP